MKSTKTKPKRRTVKKVDPDRAYLELDEQGLRITEKVDTYEKVDVDLDDETFMKLALMAHEKDITFNKLCEQLISDYLKKNPQTKEKKSK